MSATSTEPLALIIENWLRNEFVPEDFERWPSMVAKKLAARFVPVDSDEAVDVLAEAVRKEFIPNYRRFMTPDGELVYPRAIVKAVLQSLWTPLFVVTKSDAI